jgi:hypothetical protein
MFKQNTVRIQVMQIIHESVQKVYLFILKADKIETDCFDATNDIRRRPLNFVDCLKITDLLRI